MKTKMRPLWAVGIVLFWMLFQRDIATVLAIDSITPPDGMEVLTRGPVHEAFAQPFNSIVGPGPAVAKEPPPPIPESPPEERPQGNNVQWISGYWAWDADRNDFLWVSGTFRNAPPGRQFIDGHWANTPDGWRWIPGFWAPNSQTEIPYSNEPPAPLETAPSFAPPDDNSTFVPGYWADQNSTFVWRPGFYTTFQSGRIWVSPQYIWTPAGFIFVPGYWDYPFDNRGILFAPVWFNNPLWRTAGWYYRPRFVVGLNPAFNSLFWRNGGNHFFFGNFYGSRYAQLGFRPWFQNRTDPLFNYSRWNQRGNADWLAGQQRLYNDRQAGRVSPPANSLGQQNTTNRMVTPVSQVNMQSFTKSTNVTALQRNSQKANTQIANQLSRSRIQNEVTGLNKTNTGNLGTTGRAVNTQSGKLASPAIFQNGVPRVINNPVKTPQSINHSAAFSSNKAIQVARASSPQVHTYAHAAATPHHTAQPSYAGRTVNHTTAHTVTHGGGGHGGGSRGKH